MKTPETDGIYQGVYFSDYRTWDAVSQSTLKAGLRGGIISAAHMKAAIDFPREETAALNFGKAFDLAMFSPEQFAKTVVAAPEVDRRTKDGKSKWAEFEASCLGKVILDLGDFDTIRYMAEALNRHPAAREIGAADGMVQPSLIWSDRGIRIKGQPDKVIGSTLVDLKSARAAHPVAVSKAIDEYGYHIQAACYWDGLERLGHRIDEIVILFVEKFRPHCPYAVRMGRRTLETAARKYEDLLTTYAACMKSGVWPGYSEWVEEIELKEWALDPMEGEESL